MKNKIVKSLILSFALLIPLNSHAMSFVQCADVYPCDENGDLLPEFQVSGYCGQANKATCATDKAALEHANFRECKMELQKRDKKYDKKIRMLKREILKYK